MELSASASTAPSQGTKSFVKHAPLIFLELNEVNFAFIKGYVARGELPAFSRFLDAHGFTRTTSVQRYEELEPWIQWVTAHTGKSFADHGVFRLGDIVGHDHEQIWERLQGMGLSVGAVSPMNAKLRMQDPAFFVPDPWTQTGVVAPGHVARLHRAIAQAVGDNAQARITPGSFLDLAIGAALGWQRARFVTLSIDPDSHALSQRESPWALLFILLIIAIRMGVRTLGGAEAAAWHISALMISV